MDQRLNARVKTRLPLDVSIIELAPQTKEVASTEVVEALNMSEGGMLYASKLNKKSGTSLIAEFTLPGTSISMRMNLSVIHCSLEWPLYHIGVQFKDLGIAERKLLRDYILKH